MTSPRPLSARRRFLYACLATLLFFGGAECGLVGLSAVVYRARVSSLNPDADPRPAADVLRIVTLGDSLTAGQGTAPEYSYPRQLANLLARTNPDRSFEVINLGVYALNSSRLADLLPGWMERYQPDVVVVMAGCNNTWNYSNSHLAELGLLGRPALLAVLDRTRTYRMLRLLLRRDRGRIAILAEPEPPLKDRMKLPSDLAPMVDGTARTHERQDRLFADPSALTELYRYDLALIQDRVRAGGGQLILLTYPFKPDGFPHRALTQRFGATQGVPVADVFEVFDELGRRRPDLDPFSADRGHPNALGYGLVADAVYRAMKQQPERFGPLLDPPDPLATVRDPAYLLGVLDQLLAATARSDADEYTWEARGHIEIELQRWDDARSSFETAYVLSRGAPQFVEALAWLYGLRGTEADLDSLVERTIELRSSRSDIDDIVSTIKRARKVVQQRAAGKGPTVPGAAP